MALKQCTKCNEMVDEAKAFCPGCGNAFVEEEQRQQKSQFERMDNTVQFGQTMYNQMLSDMGLNISKPTNAPEKRIEVIAPAATILKPAVAAAEPTKPQQPVSENKPGNTKWYILGAVLVVLVILLTVVATGLLYFYWTGFRF